MNPNIEVIAHDLWAVNFQWVKEGWIKELRFVPDAKCNCEYACLKDDGTERLYLNVMEWEIKRRCIKQAYLLNHPKSTLKEKIKKYLWKVGEKYGFYQNSD